MNRSCHTLDRLRDQDLSQKLVFLRDLWIQPPPVIEKPSTCRTVALFSIHMHELIGQQRAA